MAAHTPGPWTMRVTKKLVYVFGPKRRYITQRTIQFISKDKRERVIGDCELIAGAPDHAVFAAAVCKGVARWEPFSGSSDRGEVCCNGMRYSTILDEFGCPILSVHSRAALAKETS